MPRVVHHSHWDLAIYEERANNLIHGRMVFKYQNKLFKVLTTTTERHLQLTLSMLQTGCFSVNSNRIWAGFKGKSPGIRVGFYNYLTGVDYTFPF